ncbi:carbohydrate kinase [candidate division KSB1 bacterium]|nr:carbohydrate kinase [candidate division KSB1 bacterium]
MPCFSPLSIENILKNIPEKKIAVIGDFFLDKYLIIDPALAEISLETGKISNQVVDIYHSPGAAGTVTSNLMALGVGKIFAIGAIGNDGTGYELIDDLTRLKVDHRYLIRNNSIFTPTYTKPMKIMGQKREEQERLDIKNRKPLLPEIENQVLNHLDDCINKIDGLIVADQVEERNHGIITDKVRTRISELGAQYPKKVIFADSRNRIGLFRNAMIKPNKFEAHYALFRESKKNISIEQAKDFGKKLNHLTNRPVFVTLEKDGLLVCADENAIQIPTLPVAGEIDPVGAGDSVAAGIVAALCTGASLELAAFMGMVVASITIQKIGTTGTASPAEIRQRMKEYQD